MNRLTKKKYIYIYSLQKLFENNSMCCTHRGKMLVQHRDLHLLHCWSV